MDGTWREVRQAGLQDRKREGLSLDGSDGDSTISTPEFARHGRRTLHSGSPRGGSGSRTLDSDRKKDQLEREILVLEESIKELTLHADQVKRELGMIPEEARGGSLSSHPTVSRGAAMLRTEQAGQDDGQGRNVYGGRDRESRTARDFLYPSSPPQIDKLPTHWRDRSKTLVRDVLKATSTPLGSEHGLTRGRRERFRPMEREEQFGYYPNRREEPMWMDSPRYVRNTGRPVKEKKPATYDGKTSWPWRQWDQRTAD